MEQGDIETNVWLNAQFRQSFPSQAHDLACWFSASIANETETVSIRSLSSLFSRSCVKDGFDLGKYPSGRRISKVHRAWQLPFLHEYFNLPRTAL
jgi:hypothetical protein